MAAAGGGVRDGLAYLEADPDTQAVMYAIAEVADDMVEIREARGIGIAHGVVKPGG